MINTMIRWSRSIHFRITFAAVMGIAFALAAVGLCVSTIVDQEVGDFRQEFERARVMKLSQVLGDTIADGNREDIEAAVDAARALDELQIVITDVEGRVIDISEERSLVVPIERFTILSKDRDIEVGRYVDSEPTDTIAQPQWSQISSEVTKWLILVGLTTGCLVILLVSLLLRRTLRPVRVLATAARRLGEGDLSQRIPEGGHDELGLLSDTFNTMAEGLEKAEKQRRNLMADVAHELRTPIFNIQGRLEAIAEGAFEPDADTINSMHQQAKHLNNLVEDVRTLALAESRELQLDIQPHSITEVLERCVEDFQAQAQPKGISLTILTDTDIPSIPIDRTRISQVLQNLLQNAIHHTPSGGEVQVSARRTDQERMTVSVGDTGPGIPKESLPFVFDRFYRADKARALNTGGSGLGLAIAKELVEAHGGKIWVESREGRGSTFCFSLPLRRGRDAGKASLETAE
jgi:signal transduction histidine kinase